MCVRWADITDASSSCSRPKLLAGVPSTTTSAPSDPAVAGSGSSVLADAARQPGDGGRSHHGAHDANLSFNSSTLRSKSPNSRIRKQPDMPPRQHGKFPTNSASSVRWSIWNAHVVLVMLLTVSTSSSALLNCRCQRLTSPWTHLSSKPHAVHVRVSRPKWMKD